MSEKKRKPRAIGLTCGIGSMLIGAKQAGFEIVGNIEWRKYYHTGTFEHNFKKAFMVKSIDELDEVPKNIDLAMGHPECGAYSNLQTTGLMDVTDPGDLPLFIELVTEIHPRFFVMDNLPKSLMGLPIEQWAGSLSGEYDLFPEWVSNYHYGNTQFNRRRFFMIGALKKERFVFSPSEFEHTKTLWDVIKDLPPKKDLRAINHVHMKDETEFHSGWNAQQFKMKTKTGKITLGQFKKQIKDYPTGKNLQYWNRAGELKLRPGYCKIKLKHRAPVMTGGGSALHNHFREDNLNPLTARERARIQGCPDDFIFQPINFLEDYKNENAVYKQLGKFMPIEFCLFVSKQIMAKCRGKKFKVSGERKVKYNPYVDAAKKWYCKTIGYKHQKKVCASCWLNIGCSGPDSIDNVPAVPPVPVPMRGEKKPGKKAVLIKKRPKKVVVNFDPCELVTIKKLKNPPDDYHCRCKYCQKILGVLRRDDGSKYSKNDRRKYYSDKDMKHIAKTPLHIARYAIQTFTKESDWVLDPTIGSGTTGVEALTHNRKIVGCEIEFFDILKANIAKHREQKGDAILFHDDARNIKKYLGKVGKKFSLVVNNPPYSGDQGQQFCKNFGADADTPYLYKKGLKNLAFLGENEEYWNTMAQIYRDCVSFLKPGGHFVIGVKDMMRDQKPYKLHVLFAELLSQFMEYTGTVLLPHHPPTLFMNTYQKRYPTVKKIPRYQTIIIFRKKGGRK